MKFSRSITIRLSSRTIVFVAALLFAAAALSLSAFAQEGFESKDNVKVEILASQDAIRPGDIFKVAVRIEIAKGFHIYSAEEKTNTPTVVRPSPAKGLLWSKPLYPKPVEKFLGEKMLLHEGTVAIFLLGKAEESIEPGERTITFLLNFQTCTDEGCKIPSTDVPYTVTIAVAPKGRAVKETHAELFAGVAIPSDFTAPSQPASNGGEGEQFQKTLVEKGVIFALLSAFWWGIVSSLTPCVYPMIPITLSFFTSQVSASRSKLVVMASIYVLGIAVTYSTLGVVAGLSGKAFGAMMGDPYVIVPICLVLGALGLSMFGLYEFRLPSFMTGGLSTAKRGNAGAFAMGLLFGVVAAPCLGPIVLGILAVISSTGDALLGFFAMFFYSIGLGLLFFVIALFPGLMPRAGAWMVIVKNVFGVVIFGMVVYFFSFISSLLVVSAIAGGFLFVFVCYLLFHLIKGQFSAPSKALIALLLILSTLGGAFFTVGLSYDGDEGLSLPENFLAELLGKKGKIADVAVFNERMARARKDHRPVMIDFWAMWCASCKKLDESVMSSEEVRNKAREKNVVVLSADVTEAGGTLMKKLVKEYGFKGVPALAFHDSNGNMLKEKFLTEGTITIDRILRILDEIE